MLKILKYTLRELDSIEDSPFTVGEFQIAGFIRVLTAEYQNSQPVIWVLVDPENHSTTSLTVFSTGTGHGAVLPDSNYIGTLMSDNFVWHLFEVHWRV